MNRTGMNRLVRLARLILAAAFLPLSIGPTMHAEAGQPRYLVSFIGNTSKPICVGQTKAVKVYFELGEGQSETQPPSILLEYTNGRVLSQSTADSYSRGFAFFTFTAEAPGTATLTATAHPGGGTAKASFTVLKECNYSYSLVLTMHLAINDDRGFLEYEAVASSRANVAAQQQAGSVSLIEVPMKTQLNVLAFRWPPDLKCRTGPELWTHSGGEGTIGVAAEIGQGDDGGVTLTLSNPDVPATNSYTAICQDGTITQNPGSSIFSSRNPWIKETFPSDGGSKKIRISEYDEAVERLKKVEGVVVVYYYAILTVARYK